MCNIELIIESISTSSERFSKRISRRSLADEAGYFKETCNAFSRFFQKFHPVFVVLQIVVDVRRFVTYLQLGFSKVALSDYLISAGP